jgi:tRNA threonylcarbamoyl adenosine modification protein (Sua5/YciO/YrdC/YwlC family)
MTETIKLDKINQKEITKKIKSGDIFIYPTDIGYCIGCDALKSGSVSIIKQTIKSKLSIISPNKQWISKNFEIINKNYIKKLPGPYTFILKSKKRPVARNVNPGEKKFRIRMPEHKIQKIIKSIGTPVIAANIIKKRPITKIKQIPWKVSKISDLILDYGTITKTPSSIIDLSTDIPLIVRG